MFQTEISKQKSGYWTKNLGKNRSKVINIRNYLHFMPKITNLCTWNYLETRKPQLSKMVITNILLFTPELAYEDRIK